jgi:hypothetical protein
MANTEFSKNRFIGPGKMAVETIKGNTFEIVPESKGHE